MYTFKVELLLYAEIKHSDLLKFCEWLAFSNQSNLLLYNRVFSYAAEICFWIGKLDSSLQHENMLDLALEIFANVLNAFKIYIFSKRVSGILHKMFEKDLLPNKRFFILF